jgi:hypothetical protein
MRKYLIVDCPKIPGKQPQKHYLLLQVQRWVLVFLLNMEKDAVARKDSLCENETTQGSE